jgi:MOSC domain-containing protein YiiM
VLQGIETDAPKSPCRFIAKKMGDEAMRRFMKGDGDNYWDHPDGRQVE